MRMWEVEAFDHRRCSFGRLCGLANPRPLLALPEGPAGGLVQRSEAQQCGHLDRRERRKSCRPSLDAGEGMVYIAQETAKFSDWCVHAC